MAERVCAALIFVFPTFKEGEWQKHNEKLGNFILLKSEPRIFYAPVSLSLGCPPHTYKW